MSRLTRKGYAGVWVGYNDALGRKFPKAQLLVHGSALPLVDVDDHRPGVVWLSTSHGDYELSPRKALRLAFDLARHALRKLLVGLRAAQ